MHKLNKQKLKIFTNLIVLLFLGLSIGYSQGYYQAIGIYPKLPFIQDEVVIMPPETEPIEQTFEDVSAFIADDITNKEPYEEGMNCVDYALVVARNAQWIGLSPEIVRVDYEVGFSHAMLMFVTADQGCVFIDPQTDKVFDAFKIGDIYDSKEITGLFLLRLNWIPPEKYLTQGGNDNG